LEKFDYKYKKAWVVDIVTNTLVTQFEGGKEQRRPKGLPFRVFKLEFDKTKNYNNDAEDIANFFLARKGKYEPFLWDYKDSEGNIIEADIKVRLNQDKLSREVFDNKAHSFSIELKELV
jgi:phage-related protein